ncbi:TPA: UDP-N-acetylenolpyruvoylglucosamine reductase, partial [Streptococcus pneumoniae]
MKTFLVKQKFRLGGERFAIKDDRGEIAYQVEGSFFKIPKTFTIYDAAGEQVS